MRMKKIIGIILIVFSVFILVSCNTNKGEAIRLNGEVSIKIEVGEEYIDRGVIYPEKYVLVTNGEVNANKLGKYEIKYSVYTDGGEIVKELFRFIEVVDTQKPIYIEKNNQIFYAGFQYSIDDFLESYSDNYDSKNSLLISTNNNFIFNEPGMKEIEIKITDTSGNKTIYNTTVDVILDFEKLLDHVYRNETYKVRKGVTGIGSSYTTITIDSNTSFSYYDIGSLHFLKSFSSELGDRASIQISATYGKFDNTSLNYHISKTGGQYSVGFIDFDATLDYDSLIFNSFRSTINNLNLNERDMIDEMNPRVLGVLIEFKEYVEQTLGIKFK